MYCDYVREHVFLETHTKDLWIKEHDVYRLFSNGSKDMCVRAPICARSPVCVESERAHACEHAEINGKAKETGC